MKIRCLQINSSFGEVDFLLFVQRWPPTVCLQVSKTIACEIPAGVNYWVIHGLWPNSLTPPNPSYCNKSSPFDMKMIQPLIHDLGKDWPNFFVHHKDSSFWKHEWEKHGTCATFLPALSSEKLYFAKSLELKEQYDLIEIFTGRGIVSRKDQPYSLNNVSNALYAHLKVRTLIGCEYAKHFKYPLLSSVEICIDLNCNLIDCPVSLEGCKAESVLYLPIERVDLKVTSTKPTFSDWIQRYYEYRDE
ncbi:ribonuclease Oy-like isoform X3 [Tachypleus tridentatus]|uniref:ribonuclease Oy-like isoform X3 n=1 Tax=Tachypleus tridentatus TaxID=6853 RepID=UPI003FD47388